MPIINQEIPRERPPIILQTLGKLKIVKNLFIGQGNPWHSFYFTCSLYQITWKVLELCLNAGKASKILQLKCSGWHKQGSKVCIARAISCTHINLHGFQSKLKLAINMRFIAPIHCSYLQTFHKILPRPSQLA